MLDLSETLGMVARNLVIQAERRLENFPREQEAIEAAMELPNEGERQAGLTLRLAGTATTGNRTLAARGLATIWFNSASEAVASGPGVS